MVVKKLLLAFPPAALKFGNSLFDFADLFSRYFMRPYSSAISALISGAALADPRASRVFTVSLLMPSQMASRTLLVWWPRVHSHRLACCCNRVYSCFALLAVRASRNWISSEKHSSFFAGKLVDDSALSALCAADWVLAPPQCKALVWCLCSTAVQFPLVEFSFSRSFSFSFLRPPGAVDLQATFSIYCHLYHWKHLN